MCDNLGTCGECELFENDLRVLGDTWLMDAFTDLEGDETVPKFTAWCSHAVKYGDPERHDPRAGFVAEDEPACPDKVECCPGSVSAIVSQWLVENGYDALFNADQECGCDYDDVMPCSCIGEPQGCVPAYAYHCEWCMDADDCRSRHRLFSEEPYTTYSDDPDFCHPRYAPPFGDGDRR